MADGNSPNERWYSTAELAGRPGMPGTERGVLKWACARGVIGRKKDVGKGLLYPLSSLPEVTQVALTKPLLELPDHVRDVVEERALEENAAWESYRRSPESLRLAADRRAGVLRSVRALRRNGTSLMTARQLVAAAESADGHPISAATIARWESDVKGYPSAHWPALLIPRYTGRVSVADIEPEAWEIFKADYLRPEQPTMAACYNRLLRIAAQRGWTLPSLKTFQRRVKDLPNTVVVLKRQGADALSDIIPSQRRDKSSLHAMEMVNADGHKFDVFVRWPDGTIARPILLGVQDMYSGKLLAYRVASTESTQLVQLAFRDLVERYGIPRKVLLDNGRAFASKSNTGGTPNRFRFTVKEEDPKGLLVRLGCDVIWATPYHGQAKPIERAWRDLCETIAKSVDFSGAYTGNKPDAKPENYQSAAVDLDTFVSVLEREVTLHNARTGRRSAVARGRSFDQVFAESYAVSPIVKATSAQLADLLLSTKLRKLSSRDGSLTMFGNRYWSSEMVEFLGMQVHARFDPDHLDRPVQIYSVTGTWMVEAPLLSDTPVLSEEGAQQIARARRQLRHATRKMADAEIKLTVAQVAAMQPDAPQPDAPVSNVVAPFAMRRHAAVVPLQRTGTDDAPIEDDLSDIYAQMAANADRANSWNYDDEN